MPVPIFSEFLDAHSDDPYIGKRYEYGGGTWVIVAVFMVTDEFVIGAAMYDEPAGRPAPPSGELMAPMHCFRVLKTSIF